MVLKSIKNNIFLYLLSLSNCINYIFYFPLILFYLVEEDNLQYLDFIKIYTFFIIITCLLQSTVSGVVKRGQSPIIRSIISHLSRLGNQKRRYHRLLQILVLSSFTAYNICAVVLIIPPAPPARSLPKHRKAFLDLLWEKVPRCRS